MVERKKQKEKNADAPTFCRQSDRIIFVVSELRAQLLLTIPITLCFKFHFCRNDNSKMLGSRM